MKIDPVRRYALSLEAVTEEPHHNYSSFRVRGKIFVTIPPDEDFVEKLLWGSKVLGLRVSLASATPAVVKSLVSKAYDTRVQKDAAPKAPRTKSKAAKA